LTHRVKIISSILFQRKKMKHIFVAVSLAVMALAAHAQTQPNQSAIQIFGNIDAGVVSAGKVGTNNSNATMFLNSPMDTSRVGLITTESLGQGRSVGLRLESQIQPGDGSQGAASGTGATNAVFSRDAHLFYNDSWGRVVAGRQLSSAYQAMIVGDVRGGKNFGSSLSFWADGSSFGGTTTAKTGIGTLTGANYTSNSVRYETPKFGPVRGIVQRAFGGVSSNSALGDVNASTSTVLALHYNQGPVNAAVGYRSATSSAGVTTGQHYSVGGTYDLGKWRAGLGYLSVQNPNGAGAANTKFDLKMYSARYRATDRLAVSGGFYQLGDKINSNNGANMLSLVADYDLSRRTGIYAGWAQVANKGASGFSPYGGGAANLNSLAGSSALPSVMQTAGQTQQAIVVGMNHRF
jgi:predicted porin